MPEDKKARTARCPIHTLRPWELPYPARTNNSKAHTDMNNPHLQSAYWTLRLVNAKYVFYSFLPHPNPIIGLASPAWIGAGIYDADDAETRSVMPTWQ